jgi:osmotically-inducible protein OsmY
MTNPETKTDRQIQEDVLLELRWDSKVDETEIGVQVEKGIVTLSGFVDSYAKKFAAREAAHRVIGVLDVADDLRVKPTGPFQRTDTEIAQAVRHALEWDVFVPDQKIHSTVSDGSVTLDGEVATLGEREDAERVVRELVGVKAVNNRLTVKRLPADPVKIRHDIERALERRAEREAEKVRVQVEDGTVTLEGHVRTWPEKRAVLGTVAHAPGVLAVKDRLYVSPWR